MTTKLLNIDRNAKTVKGQKKGYLTGVLYLAPANLSGFEVCPQRSEGCTKACLNTAGRGAFSNVQDARIAKTKWYFEDRQAFMAQLVKEIAALVRKAERDGLTPVVRLNGTSDIPWERVPVTADAAKSADWDIPEEYKGLNQGLDSLMTAFPDVQFYDYTKITKRALAHARGEMPSNYTLVFSLTEDNDREAMSVLASGGNVAAVFKTLPSRVYAFEDKLRPTEKEPLTLWSIKVYDGDETDLRHLDPKGVIVGLKAKGKARHDKSGFVR